MDTKIRLVEAVIGNEQKLNSLSGADKAFAKERSIMELVKNPLWNQHPFVKKFYENYEKRLKETDEPEMGELRGQTVGDSVDAGLGMQVAATLEIFNAVIRGFTRYMDDSFVKKYTTESVFFKVPLTEYQELVEDIHGGELTHTEKRIDYAMVDLSNPESEKGGKVTWTRSLLEDVTFDVQAEMAEGLGHAIAKKIMADIIKTLFTVNPANMPYGDYVSITEDAITWKQFLTVVGAVDIGVETGPDPDTGEPTFKTYGPADYCLVSPDVYWQLLDIIQMTNVLYEGSTDPINQGKIKLALGTTILKESLLPPNTLYAINSQKAVALVTRRTLKIEPVIFPTWNEYGFIGTVRYGTTKIFEQAIQKGKVVS